MCLVAALTALLLARPSGSPAAASTVLHEIPGDVTIQAIIKPEGRILRLLVRVPLTAMQDFEFPLFGPGYLDIGRADPMLRDAAMQWIGQ